MRFKCGQWKLKSLVYIFMTLLFVILDTSLAGAQLRLVTGYIFILTIFIFYLQFKYRNYSVAINVPSIRPLPTRSNNEATLNLSEILLREFDYVKEAASQAMSDRQTIINFFLVTIGGGVLAGIAYMLSKEGGWQFPYRDQALVALILFFNAAGWLHFMQLLRLRQAWVECIRAMDHIKQFFVMHCEYPPDIAKQAFRWSIDSIPRTGKKWTVFYISAQLVSILCAAAIFLSSSILLGIQQLSNLYFVPVGLALYHFFFQMSMYATLLEEVSLPTNEQKNKSDMHPTQ